MTPVQANAAAARLLDLFPALTPEQIAQWAATLERFDAGAAEAAMTRHYRESQDGFVKPAGLMELLNIEQTKRTAEEKQAEREQEKAALAQNWREVAEFIEGTTDAELEQRRASVLPRLAPQIRRIVENKSVRQSKLLMSLIYAEMTGKSAV